MRLLTTLLLLLLLEAAAVGSWITFGGPDFAADSPHSSVVYRAIDYARERSIEARARTIRLRPLDDPDMIATGAAHYAEMCDGCHLAPGKSSDEFRDGLYPQPPDLYAHEIGDSRAAFWVLKHGIKGSAMPAWGGSHDDATLWAIVAFLHKLPQLTAAQYQQLAKQGEAAEKPVAAKKAR